MAALTGDISPLRKEGDVFGLPMKTAEQFFVGSSVAIQTSDGKAEKMTTKLGLIARGVCVVSVTEGADPEVVNVEVQRGTFPRTNSGGDPILAATPHGTQVFAEDDQTVALTDGGGTRSPLGTFYGFDEDSGKPLVEIGAL